VPTLDKDLHSAAYLLEELETSAEGALRLDSYLLTSNEKLEQIVDLMTNGRAVDTESRDWMLAQVEFIITIIGNESLDPGDDTRSKLLQLLLSIANVNEQLRRQGEQG
jgi:hypothetical protein